MKIYALSRNEMQKFLIENKNTLANSKVAGIISISDPTEKAINSLKYATDAGIPCLVLYFSDLEQNSGLDKMDVFWNMTKRSHGPDAVPSVGNVKRIVDFVNSLPRKGEDDLLLVNCQAGMSRSTATSLIAGAILAGPGNATEVFRKFEQEHPWMMPNKSLLECAREFIGEDADRLLRLRQESDDKLLKNRGI